MMRSVSRKGVSPLIAAVLLIAFTMSVALLVGPWFSSVTKQQTSDTSEKVDTLSKAASSELDIEKVSYNSSSGNYTVTVKNSGDKSIENLTFTVTGEENIQTRLEKEIKPKRVETITIETNNSTSKSNLRVDAENVPVSAEKDLTEDISTVSDDGGGGGGNSAPTASFTYSPSSPLTGESISFDGSGSSDSDGSISSYE